MADRAIAVVGLGCRLPGGVNSPAEFWQTLINGRDLVEEVPAERWDVEAVYDPEPGVPGRTPSRWGGFLDDVDGFDAGFFGIGRAEAEAADPQQRILLEVAWEALEHAGIPPSILAGSNGGVFVGTSYADYLVRHHDSGTLTGPYAVTGTSHAIASGRISYLLDLHGPAVSIDTACSSSLVAVHLASQSLLTGECDLALAGGVTVNLGPELAVSFSALRMLSPAGRCKAFSDEAAGFVRSEGCGVVVLKRLHDAIAAGDRVLAVLRGSAVNQDGRSQGIAAPTVSAQIDVQRRALAAADVDPRTVRFVEAHGTGTSVGDPVEIEALATVYGAGKEPCAVGSVKTNLGHTEPAAGVVGLIKAVLAVNRGVVPPNLHFNGWGSGLPVEGTRLFVPTEPTMWPGAEHFPRCAAVSSYGFSGTNAHVVLEQAPREPVVKRADSLAPQVFPLSASTSDSLNATAAKLADWLESDDATSLALSDIGYTLARRREHRPARAAVVASSKAELSSRLRDLASGDFSRTAFGQVRGSSPGTVWVFSGQGSQWSGMGASLLDKEPAFAETIAMLDPLIQSEAGFSVRSTLAAGVSPERIEHIQPTLFAIQVGLAETWRRHGVIPAAVIGHSMGEVAAAVVAGALSPQDGVKVIARRSRLLARLTGVGAMVVVDLPVDQVEAELVDFPDVVVAVETSPRMTVISGDASQVGELLSRWEERDLMAKRVAADVASHSSQMDPILPELVALLGDLTPAKPTAGFYTTVRDDPHCVPIFDASYWSDNLRRPVRFAGAVTAALEDGHRTFVEISPHPLLTHAVAETAEHVHRQAIAVPSLRRDEDEQLSLLTGVGTVHCADATVDWSKDYPSGALVDVPLPAWDHTSLMIDPATVSAPVNGHLLLGVHVRVPDSEDQMWQADVGTAVIPWLADHRVNGVPVLPGAAFCEIALATAEALIGRPTGERSAQPVDTEANRLAVTDLEFLQALLLDEHTILSTIASPSPMGGVDLSMVTRSEDGEVSRHATAHLRPVTQASGQQHGQQDGQRPGKSTGQPAVGDVDLQATLAELDQSTEPADLYRRLTEVGIVHGPEFQALTQIRHGGPEAEAEAVLGEIAVPVNAKAQQGFGLHPVLLDACLQTLAAHPALAGTTGLVLPVGCAALRVAGDLRGVRYCLAVLREHDRHSVVGDLKLLAHDGSVRAELEGVRFAGAEENKDVRFGQRLWAINWEPANPEFLRTEKRTGGCLIVAEEADDLATELASMTGSRLETMPLGDGDAVIAGAVESLLSQGKLNRVVALAPRPANVGQAGLDRARQRVQRITRLTQALVGEHSGELPRLWVVTRNAQPVEAGDELNLEQAAVRGICRVLMSEHTELHPVYVDIDATTTAAELCVELDSPHDQDEVAWRGGQRYLAKLRVAPLQSSERRHRQVSYDIDGIAVAARQHGDLDSLELQARDRVLPGPGQVEIRVHAASLNYLDVLNAMGLYKTVDGKMPGLGVDCAGDVVAVGDGVTAFAVGDRVAAFAPGSLATFNTVAVGRVMAVPDSFDWASAAALPAVYVTAWHGLIQLAGLSAGERVLIHSASGGVGLAAIAIAQAVGAEVYATAGSPEKRDYVRSLGVEHVMDSRSLEFASQIESLCGGVDVVLNTLTGAAQQAGLALLLPGGRFIELGKKDIYADTKLGLFPFRHNISFSSVDLGLLDTACPAVVDSAIAAVGAELASGTLPALPVTAFDLADVRTAYRTMATASHIGKLVVSLPCSDSGGSDSDSDSDSDSVEVVVPPSEIPLARKDSAYIITGGLGGLGLILARWLVSQGAGRVVLNGRSAPSPEAATFLAELRSQGADVVVARGDIAQPGTAEMLVREATSTALRLGGVMHAAVVVPESPIARLTDAIIERGWQAKVVGAWRLDEALRQASLGRSLDWWLNFSSGSSLIGFPGLGAYAAACSWLDGFTLVQRASGVNALSVAWGAWSDYGLGQSFEERGYEMITPDEGLYACDRLLRHDRVLTGYIPAQHPSWLELFGSTIQSSFMSGLGSANPYLARNDGDASGGVLEALAGTTGPERRAIVMDYIGDQAAAILGVDRASITNDRQLGDAGLDSLMALELRTRMEKGTGVRVPTKMLWTAGTAEKLADYILSSLPSATSLPVPEQSPAPPAESLAPRVESAGPPAELLASPAGPLAPSVES